MVERKTRLTNGEPCEDQGSNLVGDKRTVER